MVTLSALPSTRSSQNLQNSEQDEAVGGSGCENSLVKEADDDDDANNIK